MAVLGLFACDDKENVPPMPVAGPSRCPVAHGIAVLKSQRMKRPGGSCSCRRRRRVPLRDITNLLYTAPRQPAPPSAGSATAAPARWREEPVTEPVVAAATVAARRSLRKEFR